MNAIDQKVQSLDLKNLTQAEIDWLHDLKNKAQRVRIAEFYKSQGFTREVRS